jgi:ABC-type Zn uptake system ZnuABC Zn-binding protein ZnuA
MKRCVGALMAALLVLPWLPGRQNAFAAVEPATGPVLKVLAVETYLADIARNVAGERLQVAALLPIGADPHSFEPTPADVTKVADHNVLIINGAGVEVFLDEMLHNAGGVHKIIDASAGLSARTPREGEELEGDDGHDHHGAGHPGEGDPHHEGAGAREAEHHHEGHHHESDPHFWLAPGNVVKYVENIRDGLSQADPGGAGLYAANADHYIAKLKELDQWIADQVQQVPENRRILVTNHESFGYFADRYGFRIIGTIMPSVSTGASPSAQQMVQLVERIKKTGARAIFLETGTNPQLASQIAKEAGIKAVTVLYTHSITEPGGPAPNYLAMMQYNTTAIVNALK